MGSAGFRNPRALSSALAALGTLQPRALGFLNPVDPLYTVPNCYVGVNSERGKLSGPKLHNYKQPAAFFKNILIIFLT